MARLWAMTATYESVEVGDTLPLLLKFGLATPDLTAWAAELLEKGFPAPTVQAEGSALEVWADANALASIQPEDTLSLFGQVVDKQESDKGRWVECRIIVDNQRNERVAEGKAIICW